jgi:hypothetical protein
MCGSAAWREKKSTSKKSTLISSIQLGKTSVIHRQLAITINSTKAHA